MTQTEVRGEAIRQHMADRLPSLTGLRFVAALAVFAFHIQAQGFFADSDVQWVAERVSGVGAAGMGFFFILSGFVLTWSARPGQSARAFWRRRIVRIFPNHVVVWAVTVLGLLYLGRQSDTGLGGLASLFLLQAWVPQESVYFAVNAPSWSLSCELAFYLAFPLLLLLVSRVRPNWLWPVAGFLMAATMALPFVAGLLAGDLPYWLVWIFPASRALEFTLGIVLARIVRSGRWIGFGLWPASALVVVGFVAAGFMPPLFASAAGTVLAFALIIPAAATCDISGTPSPWRSPLLVWLGQLSFAFYLVHQLVIKVVNNLFQTHSWPTLPAIAVVALMFALTLLASWLLYRFVERPMVRRFSRSRGGATPLAAPAQ
jgi:peptidoglycan/LPS O-acetylase OafA/YrhL